MYVISNMHIWRSTHFRCNNLPFLPFVGNQFCILIGLLHGPIKIKTYHHPLQTENFINIPVRPKFPPIKEKTEYYPLGFRNCAYFVTAMCFSLKIR